MQIVARIVHNTPLQAPECGVVDDISSVYGIHRIQFAVWRHIEFTQNQQHRPQWISIGKKSIQNRINR